MYNARYEHGDNVPYCGQLIWQDEAPKCVLCGRRLWRPAYDANCYRYENGERLGFTVACRLRADGGYECKYKIKCEERSLS